MDGTGELFRYFVAALPEIFKTKTVRYPTDQYLSYRELLDFVRAACPLSEPFVLIAESFSTPLAIQYAATNPANLKGLILCAGFAASPVQGWRRFLGSLLTPILFRMTLPNIAVRLLLVGSDAPYSLLAAVRSAVSSVRPNVLAARARATLACDVRKELNQITVPMLYLQAKEDHLVRSSCLKDIQQFKPQLAVAVVDGPHLLLQRAPQQTVELIVSFVRQIA
jgi:pimeloyl-ACP methyl ester carboxylesterase